MTTFLKIESESSTKYLRDGTYFGYWGGHSVWFYDREDRYEFHSELAVKCTQCDVTIHKSGDNFTMQNGHVPSGRTTSHSHKFDDWKNKPSNGKDAIQQVTIFDVQWSNCPIEVENEVKRMWLELEYGNDYYYHKWCGDGDQTERWPIIAAYLQSRGVKECLIHWWW